MKQLFLIFLTLTALFAGDTRLDNYPEAQEWEKSAKTNADAAYNLGYIYHTKLKDLDTAIIWYKKAYELDKGSDAALNLGAIYSDKKKYKESIQWYKKSTQDGKTLFSLGLVYKKLKEYKKALSYFKSAYEMNYKSAPVSLALIYKKLHQYEDAIFYYKKAYEIGEVKGAYGLGYLYDSDMKDYDNSIIWYKKAAKQGYPKAINNLAYIYHDKKDGVTATAYILATIEYGYGGKKETLKYLATKWKIDNITLQKAYILQQTLDIPKHYTGGIN